VEACRCAIELKPDDDALADELMGLSAQMTVEKGKYGQEGDFRQSIRDREKQEILHSQEGLVKTAESLAKAVEEARGAVEKNPESPANILKLAEVLFDLRTDEGNEEAFEILQDALDRTKDFIFKRREGELRIKELKRDVLAAKAAAQAEPENEELKDKLIESLERFAETELQHYRLCIENYPTDLRMKYEYGFRLLINKEYDKAIPLFQEAQREPQCRLAALDKTGLCFFLKGWFVDAIDIFSQALRVCEVRDSDIGKELRYNLARSYEGNKQADKALEVYRKLAQIDFNYKDVNRRVEELRKTGQQPTSQ
jgi:tetratricopeptide (TPR) repeat protein